MRKNFRKLTALLLVFAMTFCFVPAVFAEEPVEPVYGTDGDFNYAIITPQGGDAYAELVKYTGGGSNVVIPDSFEGTALKVIGHEAFSGLEDLENITIPEGVEIIDSRAFANCVSLDRIIFPDSIKEIGDYAFSGCYKAVKEKNPDSGLIETTDESGLAFIHMPSSIERIGDSAFAGCELLTGNTYIPSNIEGSDEPVSALLLPASLKEIGADAFLKCRSLINVIIPEGVTEIKNGTFANCEGLEKVEIPSTVTYIGSAFNGAFTSHGRLSEYEPMLIIKAPHCIIEDSPSMDKHVVIYGALHSTVQAYVDKINAEREDNFYKDYSDFTGIKGDIEYVEFVAIDVPGHDFEGTVTAPTCTQRGFTTYICQQCKALGLYDDENLSALYVPHECEYTLPLGHSYGEWNETLAAGCETSGSKYRICERELVDEVSGETYKCGYRDNIIVPPAGHDWLMRLTATCTKAGQSWKECSSCHAKKEIKTLAPLGHQMNYGAEEATIVEVIMCEGEGTPAQNGQYHYTCMLCGYSVDAVMQAHPDADNNHYCDICDAEIGSSDLSPEGDCSCDCHTQIGLIALFYKIKLFFWKLFKVERVCKCGVMHY